MEDKIILKNEEMEEVNGGIHIECNTDGRKCPKCGSTNVKLSNEVGDAGKFVCEDCGCTFYGDI